MSMNFSRAFVRFLFQRSFLNLFRIFKIFISKLLTTVIPPCERFLEVENCPVDIQLFQKITRIRASDTDPKTFGPASA